MSHNLHYARISAETPEDACACVESEIEEFGDENNWRRIIGCVDKAGNVHRTEDDDGRWKIPTSWEEIEKQIKEEENSDGWTKENFDASIKNLQLGAKMTSQDWHYIRVYANFKEDTVDLPGFSLEKRSGLHKYQYNKFGLTNFGEAEEEMTEYIVAIDMHS